MNTLLTHRDKKKLFSYLPDVWFLAILLLGWGGLMSTMLFGAWHTVGIVLGVFLLSVTGILVKQLIRRNGAISVFMGILFLMCSLFFSLSLFSELREFPILRIDIRLIPIKVLRIIGLFLEFMYEILHRN